MQFARRNYDDNYGGTERTARQKGNAPRSAEAQNKQTKSLSKKYILTKKEQRELHDWITGQGFGYKEIEEIVRKIAGGK